MSKRSPLASIAASAHPAAESRNTLPRSGDSRCVHCDLHVSWWKRRACTQLAHLRIAARFGTEFVQASHGPVAIRRMLADNAALARGGASEGSLSRGESAQ